jgi:hypothetical protein
MPVRQDYILRLIEEMVQVLAAVLGLRKKGRHDEAIAAIEAASSSLTGIDLRLFEVIDPGALAARMGDAARMRIVARLLLERAEVERDRGNGTASAAWRRRAVLLGLEAVLAGGTVDKEVRAEALELAAREDLGPRHRAALEKLAS